MSHRKTRTLVRGLAFAAAIALLFTGVPAFADDGRGRGKHFERLHKHRHDLRHRVRKHAREIRHHGREVRHHARHHRYHAREHRRYARDHRYHGRHYRDHSRNRYCDRRDRHRHYRPHYRSSYHHRPRFSLPRLILRSELQRYRPYYYDSVYYRDHGHYHDVYRFPVHDRYGDYGAYSYCEGRLYERGRFSLSGPIFDLDIRF